MKGFQVNIPQKISTLSSLIDAFVMFFSFLQIKG